ncbi:hypothetical protein B0H14DRAFT_3690078 [Mycena olivaceomarginata]|nr:hypothetical protein B0H14DRAFT_3690078 [Mycena olivaceomarginata]
MAREAEWSDIAVRSWRRGWFGCLQSTRPPCLLPEPHPPSATNSSRPPSTPRTSRASSYPTTSRSPSTSRYTGRRKHWNGRTASSGGCYGADGDVGEAAGREAELKDVGRRVEEMRGMLRNARVRAGSQTEEEAQTPVTDAIHAFRNGNSNKTRWRGSENSNDTSTPNSHPWDVLYANQIRAYAKSVHETQQALLAAQQLWQ